jgi:outer membrane lipoprotein-sorting protein
MKYLLPSILLIFLTVSIPAQAAQNIGDTSTDTMARGEEIALEADKRDQGWGDSKVSLTMILQDRKGRTRERKLRINSLEVIDETRGDKSLVIFDSPADLKGTILLSHAKITEDDDQWLFLPALKRVKRISSSNKTGAFFGSEFAYEDITAQEFGKYSYNYIGEKPCGDLTCFVVERRPNYRNSGYSVLITYYDKEDYRPQKIDYLDLKGQPFKQLILSDYKKYNDKFWRAQTLTMNNMKTGKISILQYGPYEFGTGLKEDYFKQGNLKNIK